MSGVQKGKDGKTPSGNSEDPKWEEKGARPKEFKNLEKKTTRKKEVPTVNVKGQSEAQITEGKSDNYIPQVLCRPRRKLFESTEDVKDTVIRPESKPACKKVSPKSKEGAYIAESQGRDLAEARDKKTKPQGYKMYIDPDDSRRLKIPGTPPRKLWTDPDESDPVEVSPRSYFAGVGTGLAKVREEEAHPQEPISTFSKLTVDPEQTRRGHDLSPGKLWMDPDRIRFRRRVKSSEPQVPITFPKLAVDPEETHFIRNKGHDISPGKLWMDPDRIRFRRRVKSSEPQVPLPIPFPKLAVDPEETRPKTDDISPKKLWTDPDRSPKRK